MRKSVALLLLGVACSDAVQPRAMVNGMPRDVAEAVIGSWTLQSWNAKPTPTRYETYLGTDLIADSATYIAGGSVTLHDDGTFTRTTTTDIRDRANGDQTPNVQTSTETGSYTGSVSGGVVTLQLRGSVKMQVTIAGDAMSAKFVYDPSVGPPIVLGDVWRYVK